VITQLGLSLLVHTAALKISHSVDTTLHRDFGASVVERALCTLSGGSRLERAKRAFKYPLVPRYSIATMSAPVGAAPDNANEGCVGPQSDSAGKASACAGCPNQAVCASGAAKAPDPAAGQVHACHKAAILVWHMLFSSRFKLLTHFCKINMLWPL
jgi:hypothetical protein